MSCKKKQPKQTYLALGDSYTIGESVTEPARWPVQLVKVLEEKNIFIDSPEIIAKTGWTTTDLKKGIDDTILNFPYDWVSLLIGVNNQFQGKIEVQLLQRGELPDLRRQTRQITVVEVQVP